MEAIPLNALRAFCAVHAHGGVRAAARVLGVAHSAVSRHLAELERWLGVPLYERTGKRGGWLPTAQGARLADITRGALQDIESAVQTVREARSPFAVTLASAPSFAARWLLPRLPRFEAAHPRIEVSVLVNQRLESPRDAGVDLAVRMGAGPWSDLDCEPLMDDALYPVMSPAFWRGAGRPSDPRALAGLRLLHDRDPQTGWDVWREQFGPSPLALRGPRFASSDLLLRAAEQGQGVALARHRLAAEAIEEGRLLRPFGTREVGLERAYWIVRASGAPKPRLAVATFTAWLKEQARR